MKFCRLLLLMFLLAGCASAGVRIQPDQLQSLKVGETTYQEVISRFGTPTTNIVNSNGNRMVSYSYVHVQTRPETFIPVVGMMAGGADTRGNTVIFTFGSDGKLASYTASDINVGATTGAAAGSENRIADQPRKAQ